jgi:hypothetical protein
MDRGRGIQAWVECGIPHPNSGHLLLLWGTNSDFDRCGWRLQPLTIYNPRAVIAVLWSLGGTRNCEGNYIWDHKSIKGIHLGRLKVPRGQGEP